MTTTALRDSVPHSTQSLLGGGTEASTRAQLKALLARDPQLLADPVALNEAVRELLRHGEPPAPTPETELLPVIQRKGLFWLDGGDGRSLLVGMALENPHPVATEPMELTICAAGFGAFVPDRPVGRVMAPGMEPGDRRRVFTRVSLGAAEPTPARRMDGKLADRMAKFMAAQAKQIERMFASTGQLEVAGRTVQEMFFPDPAPSSAQMDRLAGRLLPRKAGNILVRSPGGSVIVHRHVCFSRTSLTPGVTQPLPFMLYGAESTATGVAVIDIHDLSEGWRADLRSAAWSEPVRAGAHVAEVLPARDADEGCLVLNVTDMQSGEVCPVEWYWTDRISG